MQTAPTWTALLLAGQRPGPDVLAAAFGQERKALIRVGGEAMLSRVTRTLLECPDVARVVVLAQDWPQLIADPDCAWLAAEPRVAFAASAAGIANSIAQVAGGPAARWPLLVTTADHPLLSPAMVAAFLAGAAGADIAAAVVERRVVLGAYPGNLRTWLKFRGGWWSGANIFALAGPKSLPALTLWARVEQDRKSGWRLIWQLGPSLLIGAGLRLLTLDGAARRLGARLGLVAAAVPLPFAEAAIDVDKLSDHALVERILAARR